MKYRNYTFSVSIYDKYLSVHETNYLQKEYVAAVRVETLLMNELEQPASLYFPQGH